MSRPISILIIYHYLPLLSEKKIVSGL